MNRIRHLYTFLLPVLATMLLLAACGGGGGGGGGPASIAHFTAEGLAKGDGEWLLSWDATGDSVTLNGKSVARTGTQEVIAGEATTFTLRASAGDQGVSESVTIGPVSGISITDSAGRSSDFLLEVGEALQLFARVQAEAADVEPNQDVIWESLDESVLRISDTGLVTAVAAGTAQVHAVSRQWTGMRRGVAVTSQRVPRILEYVAIPGEAGDGAWTLSWSIDADTGTLNGEAVSAVGSRSVTPAAPTPYTLAASNGPDSVERTITVAPVDGISVQGLTVVGIGEEIDLSDHVTVQATGAAGAIPSQAVTYRSGNESVFTVADSALRAVATGTATLHITSVQDTRITGSVEVTVVGAGLYELNADSAPAQLEAGESLLLEWRPVALTSIDLVTLSDGSEIDRRQLLPPGRRSVEVDLPTGHGEVNYRLDWQGEGSSGSELLWPAQRRVFGWVCDSNARPNQRVVFDDPVIESLVRSVYSRPTGQLTCRHVQQQFAPQLNPYGQETRNALVRNNCDDGQPLLPPVESFEGVQHLIHLVRFEFECNDVTDLRRLASMTGLVEINFDNNLITDVSPLANLDKVEVLGLYNNRLTDITGLEGLESLRILYLSENSVKDLSPLSGLTSLEHAWVYDNCVGEGSDCLRDLSPLAGLTNLVSVVFHANEVEDISFLNAGMTRLELVLARGNRIDDAGPLANLPALTTVVLDDNYLTSLAPLVANTDFADAPIYQWQRGTVRMPPAGSFEGNLLMGYNCYDPADPELIAQVNALESRGVTVEGMAAPAKDCTAGGLAAPLSPEAVQHLEMLRHRPY